MIRKATKKPITIEWIEWNGDNIDEAIRLNGGRGDPILPLKRRNEILIIETLEGAMEAHPGDIVIKGVKGELYPCKRDIFDSTYEIEEL